MMKKATKKTRRKTHIPIYQITIERHKMTFKFKKKKKSSNFNGIPNIYSLTKKITAATTAAVSMKISRIRIFGI